MELEGDDHSVRCTRWGFTLGVAHKMCVNSTAIFLSSYPKPCLFMSPHHLSQFLFPSPSSRSTAALTSAGAAAAAGGGGGGGGQSPVRQRLAAAAAAAGGGGEGAWHGQDAQAPPVNHPPAQPPYPQLQPYSQQQRGEGQEPTQSPMYPPPQPTYEPGTMAQVGCVQQVVGRGGGGQIQASQSVAGTA